MTRDEILAMKPGRELDALVAEKVMGLKIPNRHNARFYSTDLSDAWEVVEKMKRAGWSINVTSWGDDDAMGEDPYLVTFGFEGGPNNFMSLNLSEAISKSALVAVLEESHEQ